MEINQDENPQLMTVSTVIEMLAELKKEIHTASRNENDRLRQSIQDDLKSFKAECVQQTTNQVKKEIDVVSDKLKLTQIELGVWKLKSETIAEVCNRMAVEMADLTTRVENLELNGSKRMLIVTGLSIPKQKYKSDTINILWEFLNTNLSVDVAIDDFFMLGATEPKPIVIVFQTIEDKRQVLRNKKFLKDFRTYDGQRKVFINEYLPPTSLDKKRREQDLFVQNEQTNNTLDYRKGGLCINGIPYRKKVAPPSPKQLIDISPEKMNYIIKLPLKKSAVITKESSSFSAYAAEIKTLDDVNNYYKKLKIIQPGARHVVCAYWVDNKDPCYSMDYHDDGEAGAGRILLDLLVSSGLKGYAVFVARKYGGVRMGVERFTCYLQTAKQALDIQDQDLQSSNRRIPTAPGIEPEQRHGGGPDIQPTSPPPSLPPSTRGSAGFRRPRANSYYQRGGYVRSRGRNPNSNPSYSSAVRGARPNLYRGNIRGTYTPRGNQRRGTQAVNRFNNAPVYRGNRGSRYNAYRGYLYPRDQQEEGLPEQTSYSEQSEMEYDRTSQHETWGSDTQNSQDSVNSENEQTQLKL